MEKTQTALEYLKRDPLLGASISEPIRLGTADVIYASDDGVLVKDKASGVNMIDAVDLALAGRLLDELKGVDVIVAHSKEVADLAENILGLKGRTPCFQGVYTMRDIDEPRSDLSIRLMRADEAEEASAMYKFDVESARAHIAKELVYGGYLGDKVVAMIGIHYQGSMGLLEVKKEFRRNGYGETMERFLIKKLLGRGAVPYCQIVEGNTASLSLQRKLGLEISRDMLYWLHEEE